MNGASEKKSAAVEHPDLQWKMIQYTTILSILRELNHKAS